MTLRTQILETISEFGLLSCVRIQRSHKKKTNNKPKQTQIDQTKQQRYISTIIHANQQYTNMVVYNSKYIYPFGGSAEVPEEDPDKQIGEYILYAQYQCVYVSDPKQSNNSYSSSLSSPSTYIQLVAKDLGCRSCLRSAWTYHQGKISRKGISTYSGFILSLTVHHIFLRAIHRFTLTTPLCQIYAKENDLPANVWQGVRDNVARIENDMGKSFGSSTNPLLFSCRSGAASELFTVSCYNMLYI